MTSNWPTLSLVSNPSTVGNKMFHTKTASTESPMFATPWPTTFNYETESFSGCYRNNIRPLYTPRFSGIFTDMQ